MSLLIFLMLITLFIIAIPEKILEPLFEQYEGLSYMVLIFLSLYISIKVLNVSKKIFNF